MPLILLPIEMLHNMGTAVVLSQTSKIFHLRTRERVPAGESLELFTTCCCLLETLSRDTMYSGILIIKL